MAKHSPRISGVDSPDRLLSPEEASAEASLDRLDRELLSALQTDFPLVERPFAALGQGLGLTENQVLERVGQFKRSGLIREISAIFDSQRLGYRSLLVALEVTPERLVSVGHVVSEQPGVSHNYARDHRYNLWFTLTVPPEEALEGRARAIQRAAGASHLLLLPVVRRFKIGVSFDLREECDLVGDASSLATPDHGPETHSKAADHGPTHEEAVGDLERSLVRVLQQDLAIEPRPFLAPAVSIGLTEAELLCHARHLQARGLMRRYGAVLRHRKVGILGNGMCCWAVPPERVVEVGEIIAKWPGATHCYERATAPDWPYNLFAMLHARTRAECLEACAALAARVGIADYVVLFSEREFKKERVRYFEAEPMPGSRG